METQQKMCVFTYINIKKKNYILFGLNFNKTKQHMFNLKPITIF